MADNVQLKEIENILEHFIPMAKNTIGKDITLDRMKTIMEVVGNPQHQIKIIHVAGTSGKTSTSYYLANLLTLSGKKVGLTVSPHIDKITERIQIDMQPISSSSFLELIKEFIVLLETSNIEPTYFELLIAFSYWYFAKAGVDYAVIETGLGGLQDSTNVANNSDKICVITDIGIDHTHVLGNTIKEIAKQKAGIIYKGNQVIAYDQSSEVSEILREQVGSVKAKLSLYVQNEIERAFINEPWFVGLSNFQKRNWLLAYEAFKYVCIRDNFVMNSRVAQESTEITIPGRMEIIKLRNKTVILDGAHNEQKMQTFVSSIQSKYPEIKTRVIHSIKESKDYESTIKFLLPITDKLILTSYEGFHGLPIPTEDLKRSAKVTGFDNVSVESKPESALKMFLESEDSVCIVTGSFYLVSQMKQIIRDMDY